MNYMLLVSGGNAIKTIFQTSNGYEYYNHDAHRMSIPMPMLSKDFNGTLTLWGKAIYETERDRTEFCGITAVHGKQEAQMEVFSTYFRPNNATAVGSDNLAKTSFKVVLVEPAQQDKPLYLQIYFPESTFIFFQQAKIAIGDIGTFPGVLFESNNAATDYFGIGGSTTVIVPLFDVPEKYNGVLKITCRYDRGNVESRGACFLETTINPSLDEFAITTAHFKTYKNGEAEQEKDLPVCIFVGRNKKILDGSVTVAALGIRKNGVPYVPFALIAWDKVTIQAL